jgi:starch phosphorylase
MESFLEYQADMLVAKIKHYLITTIGRVSDQANDMEFYRAFIFAIREEIMINWLATTQTNTKNNARMLYYISMEYLPGKFTGTNINSIDATALVRLVFLKMNRNFNTLLNYELEPGLGNGGLGRLASCLLDSLATQHYPVKAYGLRYQYGIFEQQIWNGEQIEAPDCWLINENPWEFRRDFRKVHVRFGGRTTPSQNIHGDLILDLHDYEEVGALPFDIPIIGFSKDHNFSVIALRLWTTKESPRNFQLQRYNAGRLDQAAENTMLTDVLYPSDYHELGKRIRLKQEFLLVSASLQDIIRRYLSNHDNFRSFSDKIRIQINDTHPTLIIPELIRTLLNYDIPWKTAVEITKTVTSYTNHTVLKEALEEWDQALLQNLLPCQYSVIERLNLEFCNQVRAQYPNDEEKIRRMSILEAGHVRMANLAIVGSHNVNGVAKLHSEILKNKVFKDFFELYPNKFKNITNGITQRLWLLYSNSELASFITRRIGDAWVTNFSEIKKLANYAEDESSLQELLMIKRKNKGRLIDYLETDPTVFGHGSEAEKNIPLIDIDSLFDMQIKRIHEYKRQLMNALHIIMLYNEILENAAHNRIKRTFFFSGKAAAGYVAAKNIIRLIYCMARRINKDPLVKGIIKIAFIENYSVSKAELLIPAAELSEQISTAGMEASGTGNMKLAINGALTIGTNDGANIEMKEQITEKWWPFSFGYSAEEIADMRQKQSYNSWELCLKNPKIKKAVEMLKDGSFATSEVERNSFNSLYSQLMEGHYGEPADRFFVLKDLQSYYEAQKKVEELYLNPQKWAQYSMHNIAGMGLFSIDRSVNEYANEIWGITPCVPDHEILERIRHEYSEHDKCRIY